MGTYLNPSRQNFQISVNSKIFVDKSEMIGFLNTLVNTQERYVSVSRPRRFGKTMAADMICAYYGREADSRELFTKLKISHLDAVKTKTGTIGWDCYLGRFDVIHIVMTRFFKAKTSVEKALEKLQMMVIRDLKKAYPETDFFDEKDLVQAIEDVYSNIERQVVVVIDEWDAVFRLKQIDKDGQTEYLNFLRDLLKDNEHIALGYMTGILPIKKYGQHSALNMFDEYSMIAPMQLAKYTGFTEEEVRQLCSSYGRNFEEIKAWYDGYEVSDILPPVTNHAGFHETGIPSVQRKYAIYSPLSVVKAVSTGLLMNYWNKTETYEALAEYIRRDYDGLKDAVALLMDGGRLKIDTSTYQNDMTTFHGRDDVLSLLIHLGYLGYDSMTGEVFIPNQEIHDEFRASTKGNEWVKTFVAYERSEKLLKATWNQDEKKTAELLEDAHNRAGNQTYHSEAALSYAVQLAYYAAQKYYTTILELDSGKGYVDLAYLPAPGYPDLPALVIELKYNQSADTALDQIRRQEYPARLDHYAGNMLLVGIDYDRDVPNTDPAFKHHHCRIEKA